MRKLLAFLALGLTAVAATATSSPAQPQQASNVWLCHKTGVTFTTAAGTFLRFVPIRVSTRAMVRSHLAHGDRRVMPAPAGTLEAQRQAARTFCTALRVAAPVTPTRGGVRLQATLTGGGITADLRVRTQVGQRRLCFMLDVTAPASASVQLASLTLTRGSTTVTIPSSELTDADPSGCMLLASRSLAKNLLDGGFTATLSGTVTPSGGSATSFQATGTLER